MIITNLKSWEDATVEETCFSFHLLYSSELISMALLLKDDNWESLNSISWREEYCGFWIVHLDWPMTIINLCQVGTKTPHSHFDTVLLLLSVSACIYNSPSRIQAFSWAPSPWLPWLPSKSKKIECSQVGNVLLSNSLLLQGAKRLSVVSRQPVGQPCVVSCSIVQYCVVLCSIV